VLMISLMYLVDGPMLPLRHSSEDEVSAVNNFFNT